MHAELLKDLKIKESMCRLTWREVLLLEELMKAKSKQKRTCIIL